MRRVREPRGVVVWEEVREGEESSVWKLAVEGVCGREAIVDLELVVEGDCETGEELRGGSMLSLLMLGSREGTGAAAKVTILMPLLVLVLAGMKRVV